MLKPQRGALMRAPRWGFTLYGGATTQGCAALRPGLSQRAPLGLHATNGENPGLREAPPRAFTLRPLGLFDADSTIDLIHRIITHSPHLAAAPIELPLLVDV